MYKYVLMEEGKRVKLEDGIDRIVDLQLLSKSKHKGSKDVSLCDEWE